MPSFSIEKDRLDKASKVQSPSSGQGDACTCVESITVACCLDAHEQLSKKIRNKYLINKGMFFKMTVKIFVN